MNSSGRSYGPLVPDPAGILDLPEGFRYDILAKGGSQYLDRFTTYDAVFDRPDNVTVTPWGQLILCEDGNDAQYLILCELNTGELWPFPHNAMNDNEFAGANFSPDGKTLFVNVQNPSTTLAITGPTRVRALMRNVAATSATVHRHHTEKPEPRNRRLLRSPACPKDPSSSSSCS